MINDSRIGIYKYVESLLTDTFDNVYLMNEPQELLKSDVANGFIVIRVGDLNDESEFEGNAYGWARVFLETYIPPISRGRLNVELYQSYENSINQIIKAAGTQRNGLYWIQSGSVLSTDANIENNANNAYYLFIKSFVVMIDKDTSE